jgi:large subunit ribosomal protein L18e
MSDKTNPQLLELMRSLRNASKKNKAPIWLAISHALGKPRRNMAQVNVSRIARFTLEWETVAVPGKVLGSGTVNHKLTVAALSFSASAREKIGIAGGKCLTLPELLEKNPKGTKVKLMR